MAEKKTRAPGAGVKPEDGVAPWERKQVRLDPAGEAIQPQNAAMPLIDAAHTLDALAAGDTPDLARVLSGALALDTLVRNGLADRDLLDAAAGLQAVATGGALKLDATGRARAATLAAAVRAADRPAKT